jgi:riboflavin biosynthesis pyrimidine reductase
MPDPTQFDPDPIRVVLDRGGEVELDGGTLLRGGGESPSVVLRLAPWRARSVARVLAEWSSVSQIFNRPTRPQLEELDLSRTPGLGRCGAR